MQLGFIHEVSKLVIDRECIHMDALNKHFPTVHQAAALKPRLYSHQNLQKYWKLMKTILSAAKDMTAPAPQADDRWFKHGYITIIRNNRQPMPVEQLARLLIGMKSSYCALKKDDTVKR